MSGNKEKLKDVDFLSESDQLRALLLYEKIKSAKSIDELLNYDSLLQRLIAKSQLNREAYNKRIRKQVESLKGLSREEIIKKYSPKNKL